MYSDSDMFVNARPKAKTITHCCTVIIIINGYIYIYNNKFILFHNSKKEELLRTLLM